MDHEAQDYAFYECVDEIANCLFSIEEKNLTIIKDAPDIEELNE